MDRPSSTGPAFSRVDRRRLLQPLTWAHGARRRQAALIDDLAEQATRWVLDLTPAQARRKSGIASKHFWLRHLLQDFWLPT